MSNNMDDAIVKIISDNDQIEELFGYINKNVKYVGFDTEWTSNDFVDLIQISYRVNNKSETYLIQTFGIINDEGSEFSKFIENETILKFGVGIINDHKIIHKSYNLDLLGKIDLNTLHNYYSKTNKYLSLATLTKMMCDYEMSKDPLIRFGKWNNKQLSQEQMAYAAGDAYYGLKIYEEMIAKYDIKNVDEIEKFVDANGHVMNTINKKKHSKTGSIKPIYENYILLNKDGKFMTYCNKRVFNNYLNNGKLLNETTIVTHEEGDENVSQYHAELKENKCVICGLETSLVRHRIIPHSITEKYNFINKDRKTSQYIQALCMNCKDQVDEQYKVFLKKLFEKYYEEQMTKDELIMISKCKTLLRLNGEINRKDEKIKNIENDVKQFLRMSDDQIMDGETLIEHANRNIEDKFVRLINCIIKPNKLIDEQQILIPIIEKFEKSWCKWFYDKFMPKYISKYWIEEYAIEDMFSEI